MTFQNTGNTKKIPQNSMEERKSDHTQRNQRSFGFLNNIPKARWQRNAFKIWRKVISNLEKYIQLNYQIKCEFRIDIFRHLSFQKMYPHVPQKAIVRYAPPKWGNKPESGILEIQEIGDLPHERSKKEILRTMTAAFCQTAQLKWNHETWARRSKTVITIIHFCSGFLNWQYLVNLTQILGLFEPYVNSFSPSFLARLPGLSRKLIPLHRIFLLWLIQESWRLAMVSLEAENTELYSPDHIRVGCLSSIWLSRQPCQMLNCDEPYVPQVSMDHWYPQEGPL